MSIIRWFWRVEYMSKRILVVEDEFSIQRILQYDLTQSGFLVDLASDGEEGLKKALVNDYDVILLDIMLPKKDDYMTKPFSSREVVSKIKAIIRRKEVLSSEKNKNYLGYGSIKLDNSRFEVLVNGQVIDFTLKEYELLEFLIQHKGQAMSRDVLLDRLWGFEYDGDTRIVDVHIFKIREKLKDYGIKIKTIRGIGYMLEDEVHD